ncbi:MAG: 30S ribosomal protein S14 [Bacteriovoracaceae bacterium]|nr:30S ribosomal protein S14 [Bacteriovoracaceae bacterium]
MARLALVVKNERRKKQSQKQLSLRKELRKKVRDESLSEEERFEAQLKLQSLPRNTCENRVRNRCGLTGRSRGYYRAFGLSRIQFRELALRGMIPGVTKSSW